MNSTLESHFSEAQEDSTSWLFTDMMMNLVAVLILVAFAFSINMDEDIKKQILGRGGISANLFVDDEIPLVAGDAINKLGEDAEGLAYAIGYMDTQNLAQGDVVEVLGEGGESPYFGDSPEFEEQTGFDDNDNPDFGNLPGFDENEKEDEFEIRGNLPKFVGDQGEKPGSIADYKKGLKKGVDTDKNAFIGEDYSSEGIIGDSVYMLGRYTNKTELYNIHVNLLKNGEMEIEGKRHSSRAVQNIINKNAGKYAVYVHLHVGSGVDFATYENAKETLWDKTYAARFHSFAKTID